MAGQIRGRKVLPARPRNTKSDFGYHPGEDISADEILYISGKTGGTINLKLADASAAVTCTGPLFIANHTAVAVSGRSNNAVATANPGPRLVGPIDTSSYTAVGSPVYLSDTAGGISATAGTVSRLIGVIVKKDATDGYWMFDGSAGNTLPA